MGISNFTGNGGNSNPPSGGSGGGMPGLGSMMPGGASIDPMEFVINYNVCA